MESIKQVWAALPGCILAAAPSNTAADQLAAHLARTVPADQLLRIHAGSRPLEAVPQGLHHISNIGDLGYKFPPESEVRKFRILVTTLVTAGKLVSAVFPPNHFKHIFIDEAGQATEPESCIALGGLVSAEHGRLVMAGDPHQLGPVVRSSLAERRGLSVSLLERLMGNPLYRPSQLGYNPRCITK